MPLPTVTVRARIMSQSGEPLAGATLVALLDRTETYGGIIVPARQTAQSDAAGRAELTLFPNDAGVTGSSYDVAAYDPGGRLLYRTRAVLPSSDVPLDLYAFADNPTAATVSITDQQVREFARPASGLTMPRLVSLRTPGLLLSPLTQQLPIAELFSDSVTRPPALAWPSARTAKQSLKTPQRPAELPRPLLGRPVMRRLIGSQHRSMRKPRAKRQRLLSRRPAGLSQQPAALSRSSLRTTHYVSLSTLSSGVRCCVMEPATNGYAYNIFAEFRCVPMVTKRRAGARRRGYAASRLCARNR